MSLVEKIIFQIEHNSNHSHNYIPNYLTNPLLKDSHIRKQDAFTNFEKLANQYNQLNRKNEFIKTPDFKEALKTLRIELSNRAFEYSLSKIVEMVCSPYPVDDFIDKISCYVKLLVSEFLFTYRLRSDTINAIDWIFDSQRFPYPTGVDGQEKKIKYFNDLSLKDQLLAINEIYKRNRYEHTFVCKVYDMGSHPDFEFKYRKVTFRSKDKSSKIIDSNGVSDWDKERIRDFLYDSEEFILAYVLSSYYSFYHGSVAKSTAIDAIKEELSSINATLGTNGVIDVREYLLLDENGKKQGFGKSNSKNIDADSVSKLENSSARVRLTVRSNTAKEHILRHEQYLSTAISSKRAADYWHYLETIITNAFPGGGKRVDEFLPSLLLNNHLSHQKNLVDKYIGKAFEYLKVDPACLGLTLEGYKALRQKEPFPIDELLEKIDNPFVDELVSRYITKDSADYSALRKYYQSILTEAYEQRNAYQHAGYECEKAVIKLSHTLHRLVIRFRWLILERADVPEEISFDEILDQLKKEGEQLCGP